MHISEKYFGSVPQFTISLPVWEDSHFWFLLYSLAHNSVVMTAVLWNYRKSSYCCSVAKSCPTLCIPMDCGMLGFPELKFVSIESVMLSNHLIICCPLLLLPSNYIKSLSYLWISGKWLIWSFVYILIIHGFFNHSGHNVTTPDLDLVYHFWF